MTLNNLIGISLEEITPDKGLIQKLLIAAERNINDAQVIKISTENRFDAAYKAIMQLANAALQANGFRVLTSKPGHHITILQSLSKTVKLNTEIIILLDALRKQRHLTEYSGDLISSQLLEECIETANIVFTHISQWLHNEKPELIE